MSRHDDWIGPVRAAAETTRRRRAWPAHEHVRILGVRPRLDRRAVPTLVASAPPTSIDEMDRRVQAIVQGAAHMYGVDVDAQIYGGAASSTPDPERLQELSATAATFSTITRFINRGGVGGGSDDAHLMIREVQEAGGTGAYVMVGAANPAPHHHPRFDVDEDALKISVDLLERVFRNQKG